MKYISINFKFEQRIFNKLWFVGSLNLQTVQEKLVFVSLVGTSSRLGSTVKETYTT